MAIIGIGLDLIELSRMERSLHRFGEHFLNRIMADDERSAIPGDPASPSARAVSHVAARFAAKEAAVKAAVMVEEVARTVAMAQLLGDPVPVAQGAIDSLYARYQNVYGQH